MFGSCVVTVMGKHWPATSNNGCGGIADEKEMGVYVFESITQDWISSTSSDDDESHVSTESGCVSSQTEYESAVKNFETLENQWLNEADSLQQQILYKSIFEAEVAFAVKFGIYSDLITGNQKELSVAKDTQSDANTAEEQMLHWSVSARTRCEKRTKQKGRSVACRS